MTKTAVAILVLDACDYGESTAIEISLIEEKKRELNVWVHNSIKSIRSFLLYRGNCFCIFVLLADNWEELNYLCKQSEVFEESEQKPHTESEIQWDVCTRE